MQTFLCMNHPAEPAAGQCTRCGKPVCRDCLDSDTGRCRMYCGYIRHNPAGVSKPERARGGLWTFFVTILIILGSLTLLLLAICGTMLIGY